MAVRKKGTDAIPFRQILADVMKERGLSLKQVADLAGVSKSVVQGWISGSTPHDLPAIGRLAKALGMSFKALLLGEQEEGSESPPLSEQFKEVEFFDGLCRVSITKLVPRKQ